MTNRDLLIDFLGWYQRNTLEEGTENEKWMDQQTVDSYISQQTGINPIVSGSLPTDEEIYEQAWKEIQDIGGGTNEFGIGMHSVYRNYFVCGAKYVKNFKRQ